MADYYSLSLPLVTLPQGESSPSRVTEASPLSLRKHVERFAQHFKRELHYDFSQFEAAETKMSLGFVRYEAYLFHKTADDLWQGEGPIKSRFFGSCCFRWREWTDVPHEWSLDWAWFHPYFRARGHLTKAWPMFESKYGSFHLAHPLSSGMKEFLKKVGKGAT